MSVTDATAKWVDEQFQTSIVPTLVDYIKIPNKSPGFDPEWRKNGHMAKAVDLLTGWAKKNLREGLGPWTPVLEGDKLYGRGGADDGYSIFASLTAVNAMRRDKLPHARTVI